MSPISCWSVEQHDGKVFVREKRANAAPIPRGTRSRKAPEKIVIVGGGAAGFAAAEKLRREQYQGSIVMGNKAKPFRLQGEQIPVKQEA